MNYSLVALDLDDTLLRSDRTISRENERAVKAAMELGITVVIATGRPFAGAKRYIEQLGIEAPTIAFSGGQVVRSGTGELIDATPIDHDLAVDIIKFLRSKGCAHLIFDDSQTFLCETYDMYAEVYEHLTDISPKYVGDYLELENIATPKFIGIDFSAHVQELCETASERYGSMLTIGKSSPYFLEIFDRRVHKGAALKRLAESMGIDVLRVVAMGDSLIDTTMLDYAGLGVAMGNAVPEVLEVADVIAPHNDENGVAWALNEYVLKG